MTNQHWRHAVANSRVAETDLTQGNIRQGHVSRSRRRCNELDGTTWLQYSISVWDDIRKSKEEAASGHPAVFPQMLVRRLIRMFLSEDQKVVLDPFVGTGTTVIAAAEEGKTGIGFDIS